MTYKKPPKVASGHLQGKVPKTEQPHLLSESHWHYFDTLAKDKANWGQKFSRKDREGQFFSVIITDDGQWLTLYQGKSDHDSEYSENRAPSPTEPHLAEHKADRLLGEGAFGRVKLAQTSDGAWVVVKVINDEDREHDLAVLDETEAANAADMLVASLTLEKEEEALPAWLAAELGSAPKRTSSDVIESDGPAKHYLFLKYCHGITLKSAIEKNLIPEDKKFEVAQAIIAAVERFHKKGFIHRDLKPENIMVDLETFEINLTDFGMSKRIEALGYWGPFEQGTAKYLAPELFSTSPDSQKRINERATKLEAQQPTFYKERVNFKDAAVKELRAYYTKDSDWFAIGRTLSELAIGKEAQLIEDDIISWMMREEDESAEKMSFHERVRSSCNLHLAEKFNALAQKKALSMPEKQILEQGKQMVNPDPDLRSDKLAHFQASEPQSEKRKGLRF